MVALVALIVVGPHKLPGLLRTAGEWARKLRRLTTEVRAQTGIDDILRNEGIDGGLNELRSMMRGDFGAVARARHASYEPPIQDPYREVIEVDSSREYPPEGVDAYGMLADDLVDEEALNGASPEATAPAPN